MESIGAYTFIGKNWREKDYPIDLWIEHNRKMFDQVAVVTNEDLGLDIEKGGDVLVKKVPERYINDYRYYNYPLLESQKMLNTDWRVLLPADEFIDSKIDTSLLDRRYAYPILSRNLYGNIGTEIILNREIPLFNYKIHYGRKKILTDGGDVTPPYYAKFSLRPLQRIVFNEIFFYRRSAGFMLGAGHGGMGKLPFRLYNATRDPSKMYFTVWHTGLDRNPAAFSQKSKEEMERDIKVRGKKISPQFNTMYEQVKKPKFDYRAFRQTWPKSDIYRLDTRLLPETIRRNKKRFDWVTFKSNDYTPVSRRSFSF